MKIILKQDVDNLGDAGEIVEVANGYAQNYLIPQNLAMRATKGALADAQALSRARLKREAGNIAAAEEQREALQARPLAIVAKAGVDGTLYGSVGKRDIAALITDKTGIPIDHKKMPLERPLKTVGQHAVEVRLHREVTAEVVIDVVGDTADAETKAAAAAAEAERKAAEAEKKAAEADATDAGEVAETDAEAGTETDARADES